jgi:hypothetical protein
VKIKKQFDSIHNIVTFKVGQVVWVKTPPTLWNARDIWNVKTIIHFVVTGMGSYYLWWLDDGYSDKKHGNNAKETISTKAWYTDQLYLNYWILFSIVKNSFIYYTKLCFDTLQNLGEVYHSTISKSSGIVAKNTKISDNDDNIKDFDNESSTSNDKVPISTFHRSENSQLISDEKSSKSNKSDNIHQSSDSDVENLTFISSHKCDKTF